MSSVKSRLTCSAPKSALCTPAYLQCPFSHHTDGLDGFNGTCHPLTGLFAVILCARYRYYITGAVSDGVSLPLRPLPTDPFFPYTFGCYR
jgi:hypothetical protein